MNQLLTKILSIKLPWFPLSVIAFFGIITVGDAYGVIPGIQDMINFLESLYQTFGLFGLFISSLLEGIAYFGLYFPGSVVVVLAVIVSDGTFLTFLGISSVVALALTCSSYISYRLGSVKLVQERLKTNSQYDRDSWFWFIFNHWHPNGLGLLYFKRGFNQEPLFPYLILTPAIMFFYGLFCCYLIFSLKEYAGSDQALLIFTILGLWFLVELYFKNIPNKKIPQRADN